MTDLYGSEPEVQEDSGMQEPENPTPTDPDIPDEPDIPINCEGLDTKTLVTNYMFGINLVDQQGKPFPKSLIASYLNSAIAWAEQLFDICLTIRTITDEYHDYERNDYMNWGYIQTYKRPVNSVSELKLMYGNEPAFTVPNEWVKIDKLGGKLNLFPAQGSVNNLILGQTGIIYGLHQRFSYVPQMWSLSYTAGMRAEDIPENLKVLIYKQATCDIMTVWGDLILGAGIASQSISIDGLSQSIGTTQSAMYGGASARVESYRQDITNMIPILRKQLDVARLMVL